MALPTAQVFQNWIFVFVEFYIYHIAFSPIEQKKRFGLAIILEVPKTYVVGKYVFMENYRKYWYLISVTVVSPAGCSDVTTETIERYRK